MKEEKFTWHYLKTFCNELTSEQLEKEVLVNGYQKGFSISGFEILEDDFINPLGDGAEPKYLYKDEPKILKDEPIVLRKGHPILLID